MSAARILVVYVIVYAALEAAWLYSMRGFYAERLAAVQCGKELSARKGAAVLAYIVLFFVVWFFLVRRIDAYTPVRDVVVTAVSLGLAIYGVYNLTNLATLAGYTSYLAAVDTLWGVAAITIVGLVVKLVARWTARPLRPA